MAVWTNKEIEVHIVHVITGMHKAAGTTTFVENVVAGLRSLGHKVDIAVSIEDIRHCDIIHIHGLWSALLHKASLFAAKNAIPFVWSTHGMTAPWSMRHKRWKKLPAWYLYQRSDLRRAAAIHCTTEQEVRWNKTLGFTNCFIAPLGTHLPMTHIQVSKNNFKHTLLFVGRIYPVKGLVNLIKAWSLCNVDGWSLRIVGPNQAGHLFELESLVQELGLSDSVLFAGPKFGDELSAEYDNCDCLVLPSFTENFGATVVDALAHGKPCIASTFTPWQELRVKGCGWWVSNEPRNLADVIGEMIALSDDERKKMGERGFFLIKKKYTWSAVSKLIDKEYRRICNGVLHS